MKNLLIAASAIALLVLWACHLDPESREDKLNIEGDAAWSDYSKLIVIVRDAEGNVIDTLFNGHMDDLSDLKDLSPGKYQGGDAVFAILGFKGDSLVFAESRKFDAGKGTAKVETTFAVSAKLLAFKAAPETLSLWLGGPDTVVKVEILPAYAKPRLALGYDKDALEITSKDGAYEVRVKTRQAGKTSLTLKPEGLDSLARRIGIEITADPPRLQSTPAKLFLAPGGEAEFTVKSAQEFGEVVRYLWDLDGDGAWDDSLDGHWAGKEVELPKRKKAYPAIGKVNVRFGAKDTEGNLGTCESVIEVGERKPSVELLPKDTAVSIKDEISFQGEIREPGGKLTGYGWDWNGDGKAEDSATLNDSTASLRRPWTFNDTGTFKIVLRAKDSDGKVGADSVRITVKRDAPVVNPGAAVTAKSNAPVAFAGTATQELGTFTIYKWDFDGDNTWDDSSKAPPAMTYKYAREAEYTARFLVRDDDGNETIGTRKVTISDLPFVITAISGKDTVSIKDVVDFSATVRNEDGKPLTYGWDFTKDGKLDDSSASSKTEFNATTKYSFSAAGRFRALFRVQDAQGKTLQDSTFVVVLQDAPKAILGPDDTVLIGETVAIKLLDSQKFGAITKRELRVDDTVWIPLSKSDTTLTMPMAKGVVRIIGRVTDDDGLTGSDTMDITVNYPVENHLSALLLSAGTMAPPFNADSLKYSVTYPYTTASVTITAAARDPKSSITVNGTALSATVTQVTVALKAGLNAIPVVVTAQDSSAKRTYTLNLTRTPAATVSTLSNLVPSAGALSPAFAGGTYPYSLTVPDTSDTLRFTPTAANAFATVTVAGSTVVSGTPSQKIPLKMGLETFDIVVTAQDGTKSTYKVTVNHMGWSLVGPAGFASASLSLQAIVADKGVAYVGALDGATPSKVNVWKGEAGAWTNIVAGSIKDSSSSFLGMDIIAGVPWMTSVSYPASNPGYQINTRKYASGTAWTLMGKPVTGGYGALDFNLGHTKAGQPYMAYHFSYMTQTQYLFKFADTAWNQIAGGSFDSVNNLRMTVNPATDHPHMAYVHGGGAGPFKAYLFNYNGATYNSLTAGWLVANARIDIAFDSTGALYYAYLDPTTKKIAVKRYGAGAFTDLGPVTGFSDGEASSVCVAVVGTMPIVAFRDSKLATVVVRKWNGNAWVSFGVTDFATPDVGAVRLAVDDSGVWVAYSDLATVPKISVVRRPLP